MEILIIIPARGGSKGIKDKNIINICGKPLIQYTIEKSLLLKEKGLVSEVIVSTDSIKISEVATSLGASVPFLRPENISGDKSKSIDYIIHALQYFRKNNKSFDSVLLLQPTSPIRTLEQLSTAISIFSKSNVQSLISCYLEEYINDLVMYKKKDNLNLEPLNADHNKGVRRQDHGSIYIRNGSIYLTRVSYLERERKIICDNPILLEMKKSESFNLDTPEDIEILKRVLCKSEF